MPASRVVAGRHSVADAAFDFHAECESVEQIEPGIGRDSAREKTAGATGAEG